MKRLYRVWWTRYRYTTTLAALIIALLVFTYWINKEFR